MTDKFILSHELGTSSNKALLVTVFGEIVGTAQQSYPLYQDKPHWAEEDPLDWWQAVCATSRDVIKKTGVKNSSIAGVTFSSQSQGFVPIKKDGAPLRRAIIWLDGRSTQVICEQLWRPPRIMGYNLFRLPKFLRITGGTPGQTGKDQIGKLLWLRQNEPDVFRSAFKYLDAKDFIIHRLTGKMVTSIDLAYLWWLLDTRNGRYCWHPGLCALAGITPDQLSEVQPSSAIVGTVSSSAAELTGLLPGTPVINGSGDMPSAALGSGAIKENQLHVNIGTSGWVAGHFLKRKVDIAHYTGCVGSAYPQLYYLGVAHQHTAGACLNWIQNNVMYHEEQLKEEMRLHRTFEILDRLTENAPAGADGLVFTPWMHGERSPVDDSTVRAGLHNLSLNHSRHHLIRAVFEGIALNTRWAMETLEHLFSPVKEMHFIGGGARSRIWSQILADVTNRTIHRVADPQFAGAKGIALLASMALGYLPSFTSIAQYVKIEETLAPNPAHRKLYDALFREFKNLYSQNKSWHKRMNSFREH